MELPDPERRPSSKASPGNSIWTFMSSHSPERFGRQFFARAHFGPSRTLHRAYGRYRRRVPSHAQSGSSRVKERNLKKPRNSKASVTPQDRSSRISLSGLLNALDGVGAQEGRLLFATTNRYEALDAALRRPGRMDVHVEFKLASKYQVGELFKRFYLPTPRTSTSSSKDLRSQKTRTAIARLRTLVTVPQLRPKPRNSSTSSYPQNTGSISRRHFSSKET
jgi:hypothetical protein